MVVITLEKIVLKGNDLPGTVRKFASPQANMALLIVVSSVLPAIVCIKRHLLVAFAVDKCSPLSFNRKGSIHFAPGDLRHRQVPFLLLCAASNNANCYRCNDYYLIGTFHIQIKGLIPVQNPAFCLRYLYSPG